MALREEHLDLAGVGVGEADQGLLDPPQVEGGLLPAHGLLQALDVAVDVLVEQFQEQAEVLRVALVGRGRHQQEVVGPLCEFLAQLVSKRLLVPAGGAHLVRLIHDDEVPLAAQQAVLGVLDARDPGDRGDDLVPLLPRVHTVVGTQHVGANDLEALAELVFQLALPLEGQVGGGDDQGAPHQAADLEFLQKEARHDGLARAGIVGEQETDARQLDEVVVDGFELVRQRIDTGDRQREIRVVLISQAEA
ncbi:MAG TPA: hypothetical protein VG013_13760 [Gemmataceae bacterium]|nr:hypothetical protein [Gemmataceae bacterium]